MGKANIVFNPSGKNTILTINGGGGKGVIPAQMLVWLEKHIRGGNIGEYFDFVGGTSTGAIIATMLALGYSAQIILDVYERELPKVFRSNPLIKWSRFFLGGMKYIYSPEPLIPLLNEICRNRKVGDVEDLILFMVVTDAASGLPIYVVNKGKGSEFTQDWPLSQAVLASAAAPLYFPTVNNNLIDGGVSFNNPSFSATEQAMKWLGKDYGFYKGNVIHISLGTGYQMKHGRDVSRFSVFDWIPFLISEFMEDSNNAQAMNTRRYYGKLIDFRYYNPDLTMYGERGLKLSLDSMSEKDIQFMERIGDKYASEIDWNMPSTMPWDSAFGAPKPAPYKRVWNGKEMGIAR